MCPGFIEKVDRGANDFGIQVCRCGQFYLACDGCEVGPAQFYFYSRAN